MRQNPAGIREVSVPNVNPRYTFTKDMVTPYIWQWEKYLGRFKGQPNVHFLEVGSFEGCTSLWFLDNILTGESCSMTCIDIFEPTGYEPRFDHNVAVSGHADRLTKITGRSQDILPGFAGKRMFDAINIDGGHTAEEVYLDATLCYPLLKPGGVMAFDDYEWRLHLPVPDRPQEGIDRFLAEHRGKMEVRHKAYTLVAEKVA